jgi:hypothetical protein
MFDIDGFSRINEEYGHLAGDAILAQLGKRLGRRVRREDILARTGGGEFALVTPEVGKTEAAHLAQRVLKVIGETSFGFDDVAIPVTLSIGVASIDEISLGDGDAEPTSSGRLRVDTAGVADTFTGSTTSEFSLFESSRSGEIADRFSSAAESLLGLGRQRLAQAKSDGKGRLVS